MAQQPSPPPQTQLQARYAALSDELAEASRQADNIIAGPWPDPPPPPMPPTVLRGTPLLIRLLLDRGHSPVEVLRQLPAPERAKWARLMCGGNMLGAVFALAIAASPALADDQHRHDQHRQDANVFREPEWHKQVRHTEERDCLDGQPWCQLRQPTEDQQ